MQLEVEVETTQAHQNPMQVNPLTLEMVELENQADQLEVMINLEAQAVQESL